MEANVIKIGKGYQVEISFADRKMYLEDWMNKEDAEKTKELFNDSIEAEKSMAINKELIKTKGAI